MTAEMAASTWNTASAWTGAPNARPDAREGDAGSSPKIDRGVEWFWVPGRQVEKKGDHFPGPKSGPRSRVVIKMGPGKWSPFFCRLEPRAQKMGTIFWEGWDPGFRFFRAPWMRGLGPRICSSGDRLVEVEQLPPAHGST